jgi:uncharacterized protein YunC (DUF1805 family)
MSDDVDKLIGILERLTVPGAKSAGENLDMSDALTYEDAKSMLADYFNENPAVHEVNLVIAWRSAGVASREDLSGKNVMLGASSASQVGVSEGMQLPGFSTRYRLLKFTCPRCASQVPQYRIHYDERDIPVCLVCNHGRMVLQP